jgi:chromosome segregation ATPase
MKTRPIRPEEVSKALDVLKKSHSDEASLVRRALDAEYHRNNTLVKQLETANEDITALNERISELKASVNGLSRTNDYYDECIDRMKEWIDYYRTCVLDLDAGKQLGLVFRHTLEMALDDYKDEIAPKKVSRY